MRELAQDVYTELKPNFISQTQNLRIEQLPAATGDRALLRQVFVNLIFKRR
jgi:light-regulated signal transduction histidine kinase (bacteriophytochrome)